MRRSLLLVSTDDLLHVGRATIVRLHYDVQVVTPQERMGVLEHERFDLQLVCHSLDHDVASRLMKQARAVDPKRGIVRLTRPESENPDLPFADKIVMMRYHPETWMRAVEELLQPRASNGVPSAQSCGYSPLSVRSADSVGC